jgi:DNA-binding CsgD family transcriptional regulator/PAS domain-containing protein
MTLRPLSLEELSDLIGAIYDCALDPGRWEPTLERISARIALANSILHIQALPLGDNLLAVSTGIPAEYVARFSDYGPELIEVWGGEERIRQHPIAEPLIFSVLADQTLWVTNRYNREWAAPQGLVDSIGITLARDETTFSGLSFGRHESEGLVGQDEVDALNLLIPHFRRSTAIVRVLEARSLVAQSFSATLDAVASAVILVDSDLRVVHANEAAQRVLSAGDPVVEAQGRLSLRSAASQAALTAAVRQSDDEAHLGGKGIGIPAPRIDGSPSVLHILPLRYGALRSGLAPSATAAIFVAPSGRLTLGEGIAAPLFDLTPAEARVFARLAEGETVAAASQILGITEATVRTHLLRIFEKTGTSRQAELVRLAASLAHFT